MIAALAIDGIHGHKNEPTRTLSGRFIRGEPFDYEIFAPDEVHVFDAKECRTKRWRLQNAKANQIKALKQCKQAGAMAYFLVKFVNAGAIVAFDVDVVLAAIAAGVNALAPNDGGTDWPFSKRLESCKLGERFGYQKNSAVDQAKLATATYKKEKNNVKK